MCNGAILTQYIISRVQAAHTYIVLQQGGPGYDLFQNKFYITFVHLDNSY